MAAGQPLDKRYLHYRRSLDEAKALRRIRATKADLAIWRRDKTFRDLENAAKVAPKRSPRVIDPMSALGINPYSGAPLSDWIGARYGDRDELGIVTPPGEPKRRWFGRK